MPLELCEATEADAARIGELWRQQFGGSPRIQATFTNLDKVPQFISEIVVEQMRDCPGTFWLVVRDGQEICGFASWELIAPADADADADSLDYDSDLEYGTVGSLESLSEVGDVEQEELERTEARNGGVEGDDAPEGSGYQQRQESNPPVRHVLEETNPRRMEGGDDDRWEGFVGWPIGTNSQLADLWSDMRQTSLLKATLGKSSLWLLYLATDPRYQRRGVAKALVHIGTQICVQQSISAFTISPSGTEELFRKRGFANFGKISINLDSTGHTETWHEESCMLFEPMARPTPKDLAYENDFVDDSAAFRVSETVLMLAPRSNEQKSWSQDVNGPRLISV
ncbi:hypothetical protein BJ875DRAFT_175628 [Amylocarpus encephaloides]|uniref:N-acetyltransferase domain-containing protein n=1 Tax=Amylocarpus encephaloides TaxID=45428 RepID=A0A9P7YP63_9HELO|nr:hypothetical protein BJ875DRAFT_175628 [Amylocarpus encephaloides]